MFDTIHHIAIIGSDYEKSKHFYVDLLGFEIIRENYRKERDDYKIDLACGEQEIELFIIKDAPARVNYPEALGLRHLAFKVKSVDDMVKELNAKGIATGTSYGSVGSAGVAMMAIGNAMGINPGMVAGAVICGAMFGDKLSPLSDTTNLAPAVAGAKLGDHIRAMFWTTIPTYIITLIIFTVLGIQQTSGGYTAGDISNYITELNGEFHLGAVTLVPAILIIVLLLCKVNAISALGISSFAAGAVSFFVQHATLQSIIQTAYSGYTTAIEEGVLQSILNRGGMGSMLQYVAIISFAVGMGGMLEKLGVLEHILNAVVKRINSDGSMILVTLIVGYITSLISCSQPMSHVLTGRLMAPVFKERKVAPEILSRCLEDSGTMAGPMIPWHGYGVYMAGTLGVAWAAFFPYLFLLYLTPIFSIIYGFTGISIKHVSGEEVAE